MKFLFSLLTLLLVNKECSSAQDNMEAKSNMHNSLKGAYTIAEIDGAKLDAEAITISFDPSTNKVSGFSGCNRFFGTYKVENNSIKFGNIASTKKYCLKKENTIESKVLNAINSATSFELKDKMLILSAGSKVVLKTESASKLESRKKVDMIGDHYSSLSVTYQAISRGFAKYVSVSEKVVKISTDRSLQKMETYDIKKEDWDDVERLIKSINVNDLRNIKPPSTRHQSDGAAGATLSIIRGDLAHTSPTFDDGNPPSEIKELVNKLLAIGAKVKKQ